MSEELKFGSGERVSTASLDDGGEKGRKRRRRTELGAVRRSSQPERRGGERPKGPDPPQPPRWPLQAGTPGAGGGRQRRATGTLAKLYGAEPGRAGLGRAGRRAEGQLGGGAGAARGGVSAEAAGAATAPGSGSGGRAMWLLGPLCLLLSSAAGESGGVRRTC